MSVCPQFVLYFIIGTSFLLITLIWGCVRCVAEVRLTVRVLRERRLAQATIVPAYPKPLAEAEAVAAHAWAAWQGTAAGAAIRA